MSREKVIQELRFCERGAGKKLTYPKFLGILLSREKVIQELRFCERGAGKKLTYPRFLGILLNREKSQKLRLSE